MKRSNVVFRMVVGLAVLLAPATNVHAQEVSTLTEQAQAEALAKKLQNPIANLISLPIQSNWDFGIGRQTRRDLYHQDRHQLLHKHRVHLRLGTEPVDRAVGL